jgi:hypothetical protein
MGRDRVGYLELQNDPLPERAFDVLPLAGNATSHARKQGKSKGNLWKSVVISRPMRLDRESLDRL